MTPGNPQMRILASRPTPELMLLPWREPLEEWGAPFVIDLPRGLSRHVVRFVRIGETTSAVKETDELIARREYHLLRDLQRLDMPTVVPQAVVTGRKDENGEWLPCALVTRQLRFSLPYRALFSHGMRADSLPDLVDALVVLLVRLHLAGFFWGDVSLSNVLFRRSAGEFAAYLVDAETGELHDALTDGQRGHDLLVATENVFAELMDLQAGQFLESTVDPADVIALLEERYEALWDALTGVEYFPRNDVHQIERWMESLNELGFDVDEVDIVPDAEGDRVRLQPRVVESGHHRRELRTLTGLDVEEGQARRLLNDMASFIANQDLGQEPRELGANRWLGEIYEPLVNMVPRELRGRLEPAEVFHEVLVHRWYMAERAQRDVHIFDAARDYIDTVLSAKPVEETPGPVEDPGAEDADEDPAPASSEI